MRRLDAVLSKTMWVPFVLLLLIPVSLVGLRLRYMNSAADYQTQVVPVVLDCAPIILLVVLVFLVLRLVTTTTLWWPPVGALPKRVVAWRVAPLALGLLLVYLIGSGAWTGLVNPVMAALLRWHLIGLPPN